MGTPVREQLFDNMLWRLQQITTAGGYKTQVVTAERLLRTWSEVQEAEKPYVGIVDRGASYDQEHFNYLVVDRDISLVCYVQEDTQAAMAAAASDFLDDLIVALLNVDNGLSGSAGGAAAMTAGDTPIITHIILEKDSGDEETEHGGYALRTDWSLRYSRTTDAS